MSGRARRILPAMLLTLGLLLGLCAVLVSSSPDSGEHRPVAAPAAAAVPAADVQSARLVAAPGPRPRLSRHRHTGAMSPLAVAVLTTAPFAAVLSRRRPGPRRAEAAPNARGLFARDGRAPPRHPWSSV